MTALGCSGCSLATALLVLGVFLTAREAAADAVDENYYLSPQYDTVPEEAHLVGKVDASHDRFEVEAVSEKIAEMLADVGGRLKDDGPDLDAVKALLGEGFVASGWRGQVQVVREGSKLRLSRIVPSGDSEIGPEEFLSEFRVLLGGYRGIDTAEFEIVHVEADSGRDPMRIRTAIHFDLTGPDRESVAGRVLQQNGDWVMEWARTEQGGWLVERWESGVRNRVLAAKGLFTDVTEQAFSGNASYDAQLRHGVDYWRSRLDGALGVDVYGHHGVSVGDFDGDGDDDLYVSQPAGLPNRLFRNDGGLSFTDITESAAVGVLDSTSMSLFADLDSDYDQDLVVVTGAKPLFFRNGGNGTYRYVPEAFRITTASQGQFTSAALADYDRDGDLDVYLCAYRYHGGTGVRHAPTPYHDANNGPSNLLLRNDGDATFEDVTRLSGMNDNNSRFSFAAAWGDYNGDSWPDLYVANDFGRNNLYHNKGDGTFADLAARLGVEDVGAGMSAAWLDYDRDGDLDLYVGNMWSSAGLRLSVQSDFLPLSSRPVRDLFKRHAKGNTLFRGGENGTFEDATIEAGVAHGRWAWSSCPLDFDNDGNEDLYIANGYVSNTQTHDL